jgi:hypothetical protein
LVGISAVEAIPLSPATSLSVIARSTLSNAHANASDRLALVVGTNTGSRDSRNVRVGIVGPEYLELTVL